MHIENAGKDGLLPTRRLAGDIREEKLESSLIANGQNVERLTRYAAFGVHVHHPRIGGSYSGIANGCN